MSLVGTTIIHVPSETSNSWPVILRTARRQPPSQPGRAATSSHKPKSVSGEFDPDRPKDARSRYDSPPGPPPPLLAVTPWARHQLGGHQPHNPEHKCIRRRPIYGMPSAGWRRSSILSSTALETRTSHLPFRHMTPTRHASATFVHN